MFLDAVKMQSGLSCNNIHLIRLYHPLDGIINPKYKLLPFITTIIFYKEKALAFNLDRCCHPTLYLRLILFHFYLIKTLYGQCINTKATKVLKYCPFFGHI
jgi:hypothetical protein